MNANAVYFKSLAAWTGVEDRALFDSLCGIIASRSIDGSVDMSIISMAYLLMTRDNDAFAVNYAAASTCTEFENENQHRSFSRKDDGYYVTGTYGAMLGTVDVLGIIRERMKRLFRQYPRHILKNTLESQITVVDTAEKARYEAVCDVLKNAYKTQVYIKMEYYGQKENEQFIRIGRLLGLGEAHIHCLMHQVLDNKVPDSEKKLANIIMNTMMLFEIAVHRLDTMICGDPDILREVASTYDTFRPAYDQVDQYRYAIGVERTDLFLIYILHKILLKNHMDDESGHYISKLFDRYFNPAVPGCFSIEPLRSFCDEILAYNGRYTYMMETADFSNVSKARVLNKILSGISNTVSK